MHAHSKIRFDNSMQLHLESNSTALVIVAPQGGPLCQAKLQRWAEWAFDTASLGVDLHLLLDGASTSPSDLSTAFWKTVGRPVHLMANESAIMNRFSGMRVRASPSGCAVPLRA